MKAAICNGGVSVVQHQLPKRVFLDLSYVASRGTARGRAPIRSDAGHLSFPIGRSASHRDQLPDGSSGEPFLSAAAFHQTGGTTVARPQLLRPYPQFTGVAANEPVGYSWYHSLQVLTERRFQNGFTAQFNWVWSKFMEATSFLNGSDPLPEKLISDLDRTHVFHFSGIYELPFGQGRPLFFRRARDCASAGGRLAGGCDVATSNRRAPGVWEFAADRPRR